MLWIGSWNCRQHAAVFNGCEQSLHTIKAFSFSHSILSEQAGGAQEAGRAHGCTADQRDVLYHIMLCSSIKAQGKKKEGEAEFCASIICLPNLLLHVMKSCILQSGWTTTCQWEITNKCLSLLCLCMHHLLSYELVIILICEFFHLLFCLHLAGEAQVWVGIWLSVWGNSSHLGF